MPPPSPANTPLLFSPTPRQEDEIVQQTPDIHCMEEEKAEEIRHLPITHSVEDEVKITNLLHETQKLLAVGKWNHAKKYLDTVQELAASNYTEFMANKSFADPLVFVESIRRLTETIHNFDRQKEYTPYLYATLIVQDALPHGSDLASKQRLFYVHARRIISHITEAIRKNWSKYYGFRFNDLYDLIFHKLSALIRADLLQIDFNKWFWRGGFNDELQLKHSHVIGPVLSLMIEELAPHPIIIELPVFKKTKTEIEIAPPKAPKAIPQYDWTATLEQWPTKVLLTTGAYGTFGDSIPPIESLGKPAKFFL